MRWTAVWIAVAAGTSLPASDDVDAAAKRARCKASESRQTVTYSKRAGGHRRTVTGCAPRVGALPGDVRTAVSGALSRSRALALRLTPAKIKRSRKLAAVRRVLRADRVTDAALGGRSAQSARAASVTTTSDTRSVDGPPGTRSTLSGTETVWSSTEPRVGREVKATIDTRSTRVAGAGSSSHKLVHQKYLMDRCPDAGGLGHGTVSYEQTDRLTMDEASGARATVTTTGRFDGDVVAHFGDDARIASVDIDGTWRWTTDSTRSARRVSHHAAGGTAATERFSQSTTGNSVDSHVDIGTTVSTGSDDATAIAGNYIGRFVAVMPDLDIEAMLDGIQERALSGVCVKVVPESTTMHVSPGRTATIVAHLADSSGATFSGSMTTTSERVTPKQADGNPDARFTYQAAAVPPPDRKDFVRLEHTSRRGVAAPGIVDIVYDSNAYQVLSATLDETVDGSGPAQPGFDACPPSGTQTNTMHLGAQGLEPNSSDGRLIDDGQSRRGSIVARGTASSDSTMHGCDVGQSQPSSCTAMGHADVDREVRIDVVLPDAGGPATVQWSFNHDPTAGIGNEGLGTTCLVQQFHGHTDDDSPGSRTVPREVFESGSPASMSVEIQLDLPDGNGGQVHATERYALTIQQTTEG